MALPGEDPRLELTYNHGVDSYDLGTGYNHIALTVDDLDATLERCRAAGIRLIDESPRIGAEKKRIAFLHPSSTAGVLVELSEY